MENAAREYLKDKCKSCKEIFIDDAVMESGIDHTIIYQAMKVLEEQEIGLIIVGRRGGRTRFEVGKTKQISKYALALTTALENIVSQKNGEQFCIDADSLTAQFEKKDITAAFKLLEKKELGIFLIGRKGSKSRFEVGKKREAKKPSKKKALQTIDDDDILVVDPPAGPITNRKDLEFQYKIKIYGDTAFAIVAHEGTSFDEAFDESKLTEIFTSDDEIKKCKDTLLKFGLVKFQ